LFHRLHHFLVFGHEAVAREDGVVAVLLGDLDDLANTLHALLFGGAAIVGHAVHAFGIGQLAQLGSERAGVGDRVLFRQQDAVAVNTHLVEDIHRFFANRSTADDQRLHVFAGIAARPG